jgi:hypothetical protein
MFSIPPVVFYIPWGQAGLTPGGTAATASSNGAVNNELVDMGEAHWQWQLRPVHLFHQAGVVDSVRVVTSSGTLLSMYTPVSAARLSTTHACEIFTSLPCAQDLGCENPYIDAKDVLKLLVGDSAVRLLVTLGARSAW